MQCIAMKVLTPSMRRLYQNGSLRREGLLHCVRINLTYENLWHNRFYSDLTSNYETLANLESGRKSSSSTKRKSVRSPAGKSSLRRVAVEAQRSREGTKLRKEVIVEANENSRVIATSVADQFDMEAVVHILRSHGFQIDPDATNFDTEQVVHTRGVNNSDIFVFPSGSLVAWSLPEDVVSDLATKTLLPATVNPHMDQMEMEDLEYVEDPKRENSIIRADVITLGTKPISYSTELENDRTDATLAKIAFSSGLARSTKLAVLETMLLKYFESTRNIPKVLSKNSRLPFNRRFMLQKTGELLELRAQLNHYSELTDSLPDLFWDSRHELGLEGYYDQVGRALDVGVRIKTLNEKMDYAQEIASIMRHTLSEKHSSHLEWIIIILITVEVGFELRREWKERKVSG
ncbi:Required for meiotic nuclear division protein 1-like protein [Erysiphe neolycopersici]|uniref:Required for meiotic nuclear division protein 1-like protein n=1 Tax=Erysiphe neolycopersici TaxID=212602 RepID=A0A420HQK0_9PEZI|nr:Required for meiotic nuclear division protein 1-like protein [Erysiphe neolycopersici]